MAEPTPKQPLINCHAHVFNGPDIPPYIGKTFMPWPLYRLLTIPLILCLCHFWYNSKWSPYKMKFQGWYKILAEMIYNLKMVVKRRLLLRFLGGVLNLLIAWHGILYFVEWILHFFIKPAGDVSDYGSKLIGWLKSYPLLYDPHSTAFKLFIFLFTLLFIKSGRQLIWFILTKAWSFLSMLPDKKTVEYLGRYINIGRFAYYKKQSKIFEKLAAQYPPGTGFIILPMDMAYMGAGRLKPRDAYAKQMAELADIKKDNPGVAFPFVFVDPRREQAGGKPHLLWKNKGKGRVELEDCFIRDYIETNQFSGFKIYPALGYYPFDRGLLALWKYAADNEIPITTHCIRGTIFYRGDKKKDWDYHEIFKEFLVKDEPTRLLLPETKNVDFINNFTHPLNYLCLMEERLLRIVVSKADDKTKELFGFTKLDTALKYNLNHLKLCFGHYGGDDEWQKYFERDRDNLTAEIAKQPGKGIMFCKDGPIENSWGTLELVWKTADWYSIISSMMLQYDHLYADISYIIHNDSIFPLLKSTMHNPVLKERVLFGTDFYVVRNHKSDKEMLADLEAALSTEELDQIARTNT